MKDRKAKQRRNCKKKNNEVQIKGINKCRMSKKKCKLKMEIQKEMKNK